MDDLTFRVVEVTHKATKEGGSCYIEPTLGATLQEKGYITLLPQFVDPSNGWIAGQTTEFGSK